MKHSTATIAGLVFISLFALSSWAAIPQAINYQGRLTDDLGNPVPDDTYTITFKLYAGAPPIQVWSSGDQDLLVIDGLFNYQLGSAVTLPNDLFATDTSVWLGITVEDDAEITPRTRLVSVPCAYHSLRADTAAVSLSGPGAAGWADDGEIVRLISAADSVGIGTDTPRAKLEVDGGIKVTDYAAIGQDQHLSGIGSSIGGGESDTVQGDYSVISGGLSNQADGDYNVIGGGTENVTVEEFTTVGGGYRNEATAYQATIAGGFFNQAADTGATVGGGQSNKVWAAYGTICGGSTNFVSDTGSFVGGGNVNSATGRSATLCGGTENIASGDRSFVGGGAGVYANGSHSTACGGGGVVADGDFSVAVGGNNNYAFGLAAVVPGGALNYATGDYSLAAGYKANAEHRSCFVWADSTDSNFESTGENQFLIRANGGVGIGTDSPQGALDVSSTSGAFLVPRMTTEQRDLLTASNGMIIYNTTTDQFNFYESGAWVTK
jgi:hypothetical protein